MGLVGVHGSDPGHGGVGEHSQSCTAVKMIRHRIIAIKIDIFLDQELNSTVLT